MRFRTRSLTGLWRVLPGVAALMFVMVGSAQGQSIMTRHTRLQVTSGQAKFVSRLPGTQVLRLDIVLPVRDQAGLHDFLQEVYDPTSPIYRQFLSVPEFTERFGPTQEDYDAVVAFAEASGFKVVGGSRDGMDVQVEGSVTVIEAAFNVSLGVYQHPTEKRTFYAPDREPTSPLPFPLWHISGLDNYSIPHPAVVQRKAGAQPAASVGSGPSESFLGSDMRAAYYGGTALTGSGQSIGLFEFYGTDLADVDTYFTNVDQTNKVPITLTSTDGTSTSCLYSDGCDDTEPTIDIVQSISMAPGMSAVYVFVGKSDTAILSAMTTHSPLSAQLSCAWVWSPADPTTDDPYFERMASQGQNFFAAAGDDSEWTANMATFPAEDPNVVAVGGTSLTTAGPAGPWVSENGWPYSGGGISPSEFPIPSWQALKGVINSTNQGSTSYRNGPDVSANADYTYYVCADQSGCTANALGGTSFAAAMWAGYLALANQQAKTNGHAVLGFLNPLIYPLGIGTNYDTYFHDIIGGDGGLIGSNGWLVVKGYDLTTGWGSPNGAGLLDILSKTVSTPNFSIYTPPGAVSVPQGGTGTQTITTTATGGFDWPITLSISGLPTGVTVASYSVNPILAPGTGSSTVTLDVATSATAGTSTITVSASGGGITHTETFTLTVTAAPAFSISASPTSASIVAGSETGATSTITSTIGTGFDSQVTMSASISPTVTNPPTVVFTNTSGTVTNTLPVPGNGSLIMTMAAVSASTTTGTYKIKVTATGGGFTETATVTLTVSTFTITATPSSLTVEQASTGTSTIKTPVSGPFTSQITFSASVAPVAPVISSSGISVSFNPASVTPPSTESSTMSVVVQGSATPGTYTITVTGTGGGIAPTVIVTLTVPTFGFTVSASPTTVSVQQGFSGTSRITTAATGGFEGAIALSASGQPTGVTVTFTPTSIASPGNGSSTMTIDVPASIATGTYPITVTGTSGATEETTQVNLTVTSTPAPPQGDFTISASPNSFNLYWLGSTTTTITTIGASGFDSGIGLSASGVPSGVVVTFTPTNIAAPGTGTSTMSIKVNAGATTGISTITITGTGGGKTHTTTVTLNITV